MRGYFLVAIIFDHLDFFPNGFDWWSMRGNLFVTTAEGFFFISGLVLGIVRGAKLINEPFQYVTKLLLKRGVQLYLTSAVLVLVFTFIGWEFFSNNPNLKEGIISSGTNVFEIISKTLTFQYFYGWADYLRLYAIFLLVSSLAMWLLRRGRWYILLAANLFFWLLFPSAKEVPDITQELFQPLTWQLIFFGGMIIGFHWNNVLDWWRDRSSIQKHILRASVLGLALITLIWNFLVVFGVQYFDLHAIGIVADSNYTLYIDFFDKERLPLMRIGLFLIWFWAAFYLFRRFEHYIIKCLGWLLLPFGTNSLYVYTVHAFVIFFVHLYFREAGLISNFLISVTIIALIRLMIQYKVLMKIIPR
jgi:hypothetical protein